MIDAIEFVKLHGVSHAKYVLRAIAAGTPIMRGGLKQIVDAFDLVESFGGLFQAKVTLYKEGFTGGIECGDILIEDNVLKQAIELVEKCNER